MHELNRNQLFLCCFVCQWGCFVVWDHDGWLYDCDRSSNRWGSSTSLTDKNNKKKMNDWERGIIESVKKGVLKECEGRECQGGDK